tara:strand:- start:334 stop:705 length:372 start_codon:yes stop_codon:yes gene_type:complete
MITNATYTFSIESTEQLGIHPKSGLHTVVVSGVATNPDGVKLNFVATNNLDMRYADRFKVNWNGNKARMPEAVGHGIDDEIKAAGHKVSESLYMNRGARIAIARKAKEVALHLVKPAAVAAAA